jgi:hypothetical protein
MDLQYLQRNDESREQLRSLIGSLSDADLDRTVEEGWTVGTVLAHLAFWDRFGVQMIEEWERLGSVTPLPPGGADPVNAAQLASWQSTNARAAAQDAISATALIDEKIASLSTKSVEGISAAGRPRLDRSRHRLEHIEQITRILAS